MRKESTRPTSLTGNGHFDLRAALQHRTFYCRIGARTDVGTEALHEPADDLERVLPEVGAEQGLRVAPLVGIAQQHPADPMGSPACRQTAVPECSSMTRSPSPYQPGTITRCRGVVRSVT